MGLLVWHVRIGMPVVAFGTFKAFGRCSTTDGGHVHCKRMPLTSMLSEDLYRTEGCYSLWGDGSVQEIVEMMLMTDGGSQWLDNVA